MDQREGGEPLIVFPQQSGNTIRIAASLFMIFWLGGWAVGWWSAAKEIITRESGADLFLIFWLGGMDSRWFYGVLVFLQLNSYIATKRICLWKQVDS